MNAAKYDVIKLKLIALGQFCANNEISGSHSPSAIPMAAGDQRSGSLPLPLPPSPDVGQSARSTKPKRKLRKMRPLPVISPNQPSLGPAFPQEADDCSGL